MIDRTEEKDTLAHSILFRGISDELLNQLTSIGQKKCFGKDETIFLEGRACSGFYIVMQGQVKIFKTSPEGKEQIIYVLDPGEPFGLTPLFYDKNLPACATSMVPSAILFFPKKEFLQLTVENPPLALSMLAGLSQRLCRLAEKLGSLSLREAPHRLASHLIYLAEKQNRIDQVLLDMPKKQLACLLGTSAENLSRIFADMSGSGLIRVNGSTIELLRYKELVQQQ